MSQYLNRHLNLKLSPRISDRKALHRVSFVLRKQPGFQAYIDLTFCNGVWVLLVNAEQEGRPTNSLRQKTATGSSNKLFWQLQYWSSWCGKSSPLHYWFMNSLSILLMLTFHLPLPSMYTFFAQLDWNEGQSWRILITHKFFLFQKFNA